MEFIVYLLRLILQLIYTTAKNGNQES